MAAESQATRTFVRIVEVWRPTEDGQLLELDDGVFGGVAGFEAMTRMMCFSPNEGLPGQTWASGAPMLIRPTEGSEFRRSRAVRLAGLQCTIALPVFRDGRITSIVVMLFGESAPHRGTVELWRDDAEQPSGAVLAESHYGTAEDHADAVSRGPRSRFHADPAAAIRSTDDGCALSLPCRAADGRAWMVDLFASKALPIASRIETWSTDDMARTAGWCSRDGALPTGASTARTPGLPEPIGTAARTGVAWAGAIASDDTLFPFDHVLAIPIDRGSGATDVVLLHF